MLLVVPSEAHLTAYADALRRGYSPSATRENAGIEELQRIGDDPAAFLATLDDPEGRGQRRMPDGSLVAALPSLQRWMFDDDFCGSISLRWQKGSVALPPTCLGHVGYSVVPWKRRRGYATAALGLILPEARRIGLPYVEIVTEAANVPSQRVVIANGGELTERFRLTGAHGGAEALRFRITL